jgi:hypothetical protein
LAVSVEEVFDLPVGTACAWWEGMGLTDWISNQADNLWDVVRGEAEPQAETHGEGPSRGGYGHATVFRDGEGEASGFSLGAGVTNTGDEHLLSADYAQGMYSDASGEAAYGVEGNVSVYDVVGHSALGDFGEGSLGVSLPRAGFRGRATSSTFELGTGAGIVGGDLSLAQQGTRQDVAARAGVSAGADLYGRVHYGDADEDGLREWGFGFDAGPMSMDWRSEDPLGEVSPLGRDLIERVRGAGRRSTNLTEEAAELFGGLF